MIGGGFGGGGAVSSASLDSIFGSTRGQILRREASAWAAYAANTNNSILAGDGTDVTLRTVTFFLDSLSSTNGHILNRSGGNWTGSTLTSLVDGLSSTNGHILNRSGGNWTGSTLTSLLDSNFGSTRGQFLVRGTSSWGAQAAGADNTLLSSDGSDLIWVGPGTPASGVFNLTADQLIADGTWTAISWNSEISKNGLIHSTSTNPSRITVPVAGRYFVCPTVAFASNATGYRGCRIRVNGGTGTSYKIANSNGNGTGVNSMYIMAPGVIELNANDYIEAEAVQGSGGNLAVNYQNNAGETQSGSRLDIALLTLQ